jgi:hypothetical protein
MPQRSRASGLMRYLAASFGWLILMVLWALFIGPLTDPRCYTSASFGFLPAAILVPFLMLPLYAISVGGHAVFAFRRARLITRAATGVLLFGLDALFFVPFVLLSLATFLSAIHWNDLDCLLTALIFALPWVITPLVNPRLLANTT